MRRLSVFALLVSGLAMGQALPRPAPLYCPSCSLTEGTLTLTNGLTVGSSSAGGVLNVFQQIIPISPAPQAASTYPLGNDLMLEARGPGDAHLQNWSLSLTATTTVASGSHPVSVGTTSQLCPSTNTGSAQCIALTGSTSQLCAPGTCTLIVDPDTANAETIAAGNWSVTNGTTLTITFANAHTANYTIRQQGVIDIDGRWVGVNRLDATDRPVLLLDRALATVLSLPNDLAGTSPSKWVQVGTFIVPTADGAQQVGDSTKRFHFGFFQSLLDNTATTRVNMSGATTILDGSGADGATAIGVVAGNGNALSTTGARAFQVTSNASTTEVFSVKKLSNAWSAVSNNGDVIPAVPAAQTTVAQLDAYGSATSTAGGVLAVTFGTAFGAAPGYCGCTDVNAAPAACGISTAATTSGVTFTIGAARADTVQWRCIGQK